MATISSLLFSSSDDSESEEPPRKKVYRERVNYGRVISDFGFKEKFRLSAEEVEYVLMKIGPQLLHKTSKNKALTPDQQLLTALHWMGNGGQYHGVADMHGIGKATVCRALKKVVNVIVADLFQDVVSWPTNTAEIALQFLKKGGFPSVAACGDGTLVEIDAPLENEAVFVDRHGNHSINCLMLCGPDHMFYYVSSRWPGSVHDARVLRNSSIAEKFENGWRPFPEAVILGDSAYGVKEWLMPPVFNDPEDPAEQNYNRCHKATRRIIECAYGILKERFPCLQHLRVCPEFAGMIVMACATLHNIANKNDFDFGNTHLDNTPVLVQTPTQIEDEASSEAGKIRQNELLCYFA